MRCPILTDPSLSLSLSLLLLQGRVLAQCPYASGALGGNINNPHENLKRQDVDDAPADSRSFMTQYDIDDSGDVYMTSDVGGPIADQDSLRAGERGPTLLEDFIFRQKMQHFDHERVPERAVHARGAGAYGTFTSSGDYTNITAASFLSFEGKETPVFVRFSTVAGSRGSADTARDVHGFATRFYTDEGNFDMVGNNIPVFFIQDAIRFPDLIHAVKPSPDKEIPQAATAHDSAWDYFSGQPSTLHTLFWAMSGAGIPRSFRHMDGFGVHTFRFVNDNGDTKLIKWHWKTLQGKASLVWDEAQHIAGKNADYHRQDLWNAIEAGKGPEWELHAQIIDEDQALSFGFDVLDATKIIPVEHAPLHKLGVMKLDANPANYFSETEQIMFQPGHIVRGIDFTEDPLLQGRIFSYLDTQLNRNGGPNFEQIPINRPVVKIHNNNRDGAGQTFVHRNTAPYTPNTLNKGAPKQATKDEGNGFFAAPGRSVRARLQRALPSTFDDHWTQPRLFYNSISAAERQTLVNAIRFETSHLTVDGIKHNVLKQLNLVSNELASLVAETLGLSAPAPDGRYYHDNTTTDVGSFGEPLKKIDGLKVGIFVDVASNSSVSDAASLKSILEPKGLKVNIVGISLSSHVDMTYSAADATAFDGIVLAQDTQSLIAPNSTSKPTLFPSGRPAQILLDTYRWGKPVGFLGNAADAQGDEVRGDGVYVREAGDLAGMASDLDEGLKVFRFVGRFGIDDKVQW